jgi:hypothetical protein
MLCMLLLLPEWRTCSCHMLLDRCCSVTPMQLILAILLTILRLPTRHTTLLKDLALAAAAVVIVINI